MKSKELMMDIINCGLSCESNRECACLLKAQGCKDITDFHVPEPWDGDIENANVMVFSVNPRYTPGELFPRLGNKHWIDEATGKFSADMIEDFFKNRFSSELGYVIHNNGRGYRIKMEDGRQISPGGRYWTQVHKAVSIILNNDKISPGVEYVLTELAHCKTVKEDAAKDCCARCMNLWFDKVLRLAAKIEYVLVPGQEPMKYIAEKFGIRDFKPYDKPYEVEWEGRAIKIIYVDHPASFGAGIDMDKLAKAMGRNSPVGSGVSKAGYSRKCPRFSKLI